MSGDEKHWWHPIVHFLTHTVVGMLIFIVVAIPAVLLDVLVNFLAKHQLAAPYLLSVMSLLEKAIFTLDAILVMAYLVVTAIRATKEW